MVRFPGWLCPRAAYYSCAHIARYLVSGLRPSRSPVSCEWASPLALPSGGAARPRPPCKICFHFCKARCHAPLLTKCSCCPKSAHSSHWACAIGILAEMALFAGGGLGEPASVPPDGGTGAKRPETNRQRGTGAKRPVKPSARRGHFAPTQICKKSNQPRKRASISQISSHTLVERSYTITPTPCDRTPRQE
jgi:hypothetical protein